MTTAITESKTVLIADDDKVFRDLIRIALGPLGPNTVDARTGKECIAIVRKGGIGVVVLDLIMPEMDGLEAIVELKRIKPDIKILAISSGGRMESMDLLSTAKRIGADAVLAKPFHPKRLIEDVKRLCA